MPSITVRNIDDDLKKRLKDQAAKHGCSMEEEVRNILRAALIRSYPPPKYKSTKEMYEAIRAIVEPLGGIELEIPARNIGP